MGKIIALNGTIGIILIMLHTVRLMISRNDINATLYRKHRYTNGDLAFLITISFIVAFDLIAVWLMVLAHYHVIN